MDLMKPPGLHRGGEGQDREILGGGRGEGRTRERKEIGEKKKGEERR